MRWGLRKWVRRSREARQAREQAEQEKARSQRLHDDTSRVVAEMSTIDDRNHFSDIIRDALRIGYATQGRK